MTGFRFVHDLRDEYPVKKLCGHAGVSRSGYYAWAKRPLSDRFIDDAWLTNDIFDIHLASRRTYGTPRVFGQLRNHGIRCGRKRVTRLMAETGLVGAHARRRWRRGRPNTAPPRICWNATSLLNNQTNVGLLTSPSSNVLTPNHRPGRQRVSDGGRSP